MQQYSYKVFQGARNPKIYSESLYLVPGLRTFELRVNCPCAPTPPPLSSRLFLDFRARFDDLAGSRYSNLDYYEISYQSDQKYMKFTFSFLRITPPPQPVKKVPSVVKCQRRRCSLRFASSSPVLLSLAGRGVEHSRKQLTVGGLAVVGAYYRGRWALWAVQYVGCQAQLIKKRDTSVGHYAQEEDFNDAVQCTQYQLDDDLEEEDVQATQTGPQLILVGT